MSMITSKRCLDEISSASLQATSDLDSTISDLFQEAGIIDSRTKSGWCLRQGMVHILTADDGALASVVKREGAPKIYDSHNCRHEGWETYKPKNCFQSLCRIIAGQQLAGSAAVTIWNRLLATTENNLTPRKVHQLVEKGIEDNFKKPSGLSLAKAKSINALSRSFLSTEKGTLSESFLTNNSEDEVREALLRIRGIGPWSCDMFLIFYQERANILPLGDMGVRNGIKKFFSLKGKGKKGSLCQKKDIDVMVSKMQPYEPYRSLATYYMWRVADAKDIYAGTKEERVEVASRNTEMKTPTKRRRRHLARQVTP